MDPPDTTARQAGRFGLVGVFNTAADFALTWFLFRALGRDPGDQEVANVLSTTVMMGVSFALNKRFVFRKEGGATAAQAALFFGATAFGLWVLQTGVMYALRRQESFVGAVTGIAEEAASLFRKSPLTAENRLDAVLGAAKAVGTAVSLTWNFVLYKWLVFRAAGAENAGGASSNG